MSVKILIGDARERLKALPDESIACVVTSPPYYGLRDYGTATWEGGDPDCSHALKGTYPDPKYSDRPSQNGRPAKGQELNRKVCHCGAVRIDRQIGLEDTPQEFVETIVDLFREIRRVLRPEGTVWLNLGDTYATGGGRVGESPGGGEQGARWRGDAGRHRDDKRRNAKTPEAGIGPMTQPNRMPLPGLKPKDLIGIPWLVAFALQKDGWWLRQDIIWAKPNPMPESVRDRCTKSHEYIFLLSKSEQYYFDGEAIAEPAVCEDEAIYDNGQNGLHSGESWAGKGSSTRKFKKSGNLQRKPGSARGCVEGSGANVSGSVPWEGLTRNKRDVWTVGTKPLKEAHFATFPPQLVEDCILAGCPPAGKRCDCFELIRTPTGNGGDDDPSMLVGRAGMARPRGDNEGTRPITRHEQRWHAEEMKRSPHRGEMEAAAGTEAFAHYIRTDRSGARALPEKLRVAFLANGWITNPPDDCEHPVEPAGTVLDPFFGAGTTGLVADRLHRNCIGIELNAEYAEIAHNRIRSMFTEIEIVPESTP